MTLSEELIKELMDIAGGYLSSEEFESSIHALEHEAASKYISRDIESNILRIFRNAFNKRVLLRDCGRLAQHSQIIINIATVSNYLTDICAVNPEYLDQMLYSGYIEKKLNEIKFETECISAVSSVKSFDKKCNILRSLKRREMLRIGLRDILGFVDLLTTTAELSAVARVLSKTLFEICIEQIAAKQPEPVTAPDYVLASLGKMGGNELNYSSDIDLILFYQENTELYSGYYALDFYSAVTKLFIESGSSLTPKGYLYRIDFRLRPYGKSAPLCGSINDYMLYYEVKGEDWERQMLIKIGFVSGSEHLYQQFKQRINYFIYPKVQKQSPVQQIKQLREIKRRSTEVANIKLSRGGIRDIEFPVQALQLINGGKYPAIQTGNTLIALKALENESLISEFESEKLSSAYVLFRKTEHFLQLMNDHQTHDIPTEGETLNRLTSFLGLSKTTAVDETINSHRKYVLEFYDSVLGDTKNSESPKIAFKNPKLAQSNLLFLSEGKGLFDQKSFDAQTIALYQSIETELLSQLSKTVAPDKTLSNLVRLLRSGTPPSLWYKSMQNTSFLNAIIKISERSELSINLIADSNLLRDYLLSGDVFDSFDVSEQSPNSITFILFALSVQFTLGIVTAEEVSRLLQLTVRGTLLKQIKRLVTQLPPDFEFTVCTAGSLGTGEMRFNSDIDLLFISRSNESHPDIQGIFFELLKKITDLIRPFKIDGRLRPEGNTSVIIWDLANYKKYIENRMSVWEFQAYTKLQMLYGSQNLYNELIDIVANKLETIERTTLQKEVKTMRVKLYPKATSYTIPFSIKRSKGGLSDLDFALQYSVMCYPTTYKEALGSSNEKILSSLYDTGIITEAEMEYQKACSRFLRHLLLMNEIVTGTSSDVLSDDPEKKEILAKSLEFNTVQEFESSLSEVKKSVNNFYTRTIG